VYKGSREEVKKAWMKKKENRKDVHKGSEEAGKKERK
jgi:hypothetical protein